MLKFSYKNRDYFLSFFKIKEKKSNLQFIRSLKLVPRLLLNHTIKGSVIIVVSKMCMMPLYTVSIGGFKN